MLAISFPASATNKPKAKTKKTAVKVEEKSTDTTYRTILMDVKQNPHQKDTYVLTFDKTFPMLITEHGKNQTWVNDFFIALNNKGVKIAYLPSADEPRSFYFQAVDTQVEISKDLIQETLREIKGKNYSFQWKDQIPNAN